MRLSQLVIYRQRLAGRFSRHRHGLPGRHLQNIPEDVAISQTRVGERILRIKFDRLLKIFDRLVDVLRLSLVPVVTAFPIELVGLRIDGVPLAICFRASPLNLSFKPSEICREMSSDNSSTSETLRRYFSPQSCVWFCTSTNSVCTLTVSPI
jgi:hypothetical protein